MAQGQHTKEIAVARKHIKRCSTLLIVREIKLQLQWHAICLIYQMDKDQKAQHTGLVRMGKIFSYNFYWKH